MSEWKKVKIGEIFKIEKGSLQSSKCIPGKYDFITAATDWKTHESYSHECEAIVYAVAASGSLGRAHYVNGKFIASDLCFILTEKDKEKYPINFQFYQLIFELIREEIVSKTKTGTSKESINQKNFSNYEIPYFSFDYQMANYEKLVNTKQKISELLEESEKQKSYVKQLRQNILQEAIEGKLTEDWRKENPVVKGNPDFDAEALFEKIQEEKCHTDSELPLGTSLRIRNSKKKKVFEPISENEQPFEIPEGWKWVRLGEVSESCLGKMLDSTKNQGTKRKYLRNINVRWFSFDLSDLLEMKIKDIELARCSAQKGDLLICEGGYPGRSAIWNENYEICFQKAIHRVRFFYMSEMSRIFNLYLFLLSENKQIEMYLTGEAIRHLTGVKLKQIPIPLPPLAEQKEIVRVVESQLAKVDQLENQITEREEMTKQLIQSIMKDAFREE